MNLQIKRSFSIIVVCSFLLGIGGCTPIGESLKDFNEKTATDFSFLNDSPCGDTSYYSLKEQKNVVFRISHEYLDLTKKNYNVKLVVKYYPVFDGKYSTEINAKVSVCITPDGRGDHVPFSLFITDSDTGEVFSWSNKSSYNFDEIESVRIILWAEQNFNHDIAYQMTFRPTQ